jgi:anti-anti-sigma factor
MGSDYTKPWPPLGLHRTITVDGTARLAVIGEIDMATADSLRAVLTNMLGRPHLVRLLVDLRATPFIDAAGVNVLFDAWVCATGRGIDLRVINTDDLVRLVLEVVGLYKTLTGERA